MHDDINTKRTELANDFAAAGAELLDFTGTAAALAAIPDTEPQQCVAAGTPENIAAILPATICPQRRQKHGQRPTEVLAFDDATQAQNGAELDLQQLKALALAATPGKWIRLFGERTVYDRMEDGCRGNTIVRADTTYGTQDVDNLDYIAAASPAVVLGLIARIERATAPHGSAAPTEAEKWLPTAESVNALPESVRQYVHDLEARCDPAGDVAALTGLRDQIDGVQIMYRKAADALKEVRGCFVAAEVEGLSVALAETTDARLKDLVERRLMHALYAAQEASQRAAAPVSGGEREQFEAWASERWDPAEMKLRNSDGYYAISLNAAWRAWQARAAVSASQAAPVGGELTTVDCPTCNGHGLIGGHSGQTPESYEEHAAGCDDCDGQGKIIVSRKDLAAVAAAKVPTGKPVAYLATDLDGRGDVAFTQSEAQRRAGHGCDTIIPLFDLAAPVEQGQGATLPNSAELGAAPIYQVQLPGENGTATWRDASEDAYHTFMPNHRRIVYEAPVGAGVVPEGWRDCLRRSGANTDYHGLVAFTGAQLENFVSMLATPTAATAHPVAADDQVHVPDDFVLLHVDATKEIVVAIERAIDDQLNASGISPRDMVRQDGEEIYDAIIDAAIQSRTTAHGGAQGGA